MRLTMLCARVLAPAALLLLMAAPAAAAAPEPQILSPASQTSVVENTTVTVEGRGCPADSEVAIRLGTHDLGTVTAAADGTFTTDIQIPEFDLDPAVAEPGEAMLEITCGGLSTANLVVIKDTDAKPQLTIDEPADGSSVREHEVITVSGHGCRYGEPVTVDLDLHGPAEAITEAGGFYSVDVRVQAVDADTPVSLTVSCPEASQQIGLTILDTDGTGDDEQPGNETPGNAELPGGETGPDGEAVPSTTTPAPTPSPEATPLEINATSDRGMPSHVLSIAGGLALAGIVISGTGWYLRLRDRTEPADLD